ncbi:MAG: hypothetical protein LRY71_08245 [Bacillaceae bacterium]|nr:hypothetical protein [Bacillaceae bacterium]
MLKKSLKELPTGGKTPLAHGLYVSFERLRKALSQDPEILPILIVVTDGKANQPLHGTDPVEDAMNIAKHIATSGVQSLVIDIEQGFIQLGIAKQLASALNADYIKLDELKSDSIVHAVKSFV